MRCVTQEQINEARSNGADAVELEKLGLLLKRTEARDRLCEKIRVAFAGVTLGDGVGLYEANAIDDNETEEVCAEFRAKDEKECWERISSEDLNICFCSLSYLDAEGMRFHLPAYLIADLVDEYKFGMKYDLTHLNYSARERFSLLTGEQREVVGEYLQFLLDDPEGDPFDPDIGAALLNYWREE